ncbi:TetR/AcrR family transcriptional regulator [Pseudomonas sp. TKO26]|uniref:TetR/AcrR family transcriptional regulator n=1 Tax=unclassified Pseudomonas TaxID=196821 RepID=UPI000D9F76AC|nr:MULTISPECIES: TetR/AcrR family transcriptional regulator [unclassified Pseudomonas]PYY82801.1 TetR/AcrR family transcriptional regulator [Pseudomonas sp. TKO30]PYY84214.1 TetR/AcrR family transcriptional regulator [Pseudomonas sp. TKO29]PYY86565.1 TetR/AcrR family transcriptional regulator [Pseudomonas sp. TKO26]PYY98144.1 TetR/AcrR family transcriptional regulator [Pseudomonas sp. TKO14]
MKATSNSAEAGGRGSLESWLNAAYESLKESGVDAVRVMPLAKKLNLSRTSFYWYFQDREALLDALVNLWKNKNTLSLVAQSEAYAESITEAILNVFDCWLNSELFDSQFEFAMRSWALQSPEVAQDIREADALRVQALARMFDRFGFAHDAAVTRARSIYLTQIGYISMNTQEPLAQRMRYIPEYLQIFTGVEPQPRELERFFQRNGFSSAQLQH